MTELVKQCFEVVTRDANPDVDHAGKRIPESLENLGLDAAHLERHIAWDIGAAGVARRLSEHFDATCVLQNYSRLVVDCNR